MRCSDTIQVRLSKAEKQALARHAVARGITISKLVRDAVKTELGQPIPVTGGEALAVVALRRYINVLEEQLGAARTDEQRRAVKVGLAAARRQASEMLG